MGGTLAMFSQAFTSAMEQFSGTQINQSNQYQITSSPWSGTRRGAGLGCRDGQAWQTGLPRARGLWVTPALLSHFCASPHCWWLSLCWGKSGNVAQRLLCRSCSQSGTSSLIYYSNNGQPAKEQSSQKRIGPSALCIGFSLLSCNKKFFSKARILLLTFTSNEFSLLGCNKKLFLEARTLLLTFTCWFQGMFSTVYFVCTDPKLSSI